MTTESRRANVIGLGLIGGSVAAALKARGWEVHVGLLSGGVNLERLRQGGATVHQLHVAGNYDPRLLSQISGVIGRVRPAIVQTWLPQMDISAGFLSSVRGVPWILSERSSNQDYLSLPKRLLRTAGFGHHLRTRWAQRC